LKLVSENKMLEHIEELVAKKRAFFYEKNTLSTQFRREALIRLKNSIKKHEAEICAALSADLGKSEQEAYLTECGVVYHELSLHLSNLEKWSRPKSVSTPYFLLPSKFKSIPQPLGVALILAPWNYPFQLVINPLIGAISAGCCALIKPSPQSPNTNQVLMKIIQESFVEEHVSMILGDADVYEPLLKVRYDVIFFTGSPRVGKIIMKAAAEYLCPVILELGGKNPCIVDQDANLDVAAKRVVWGKCINSGQTCIAPDYLIVHHDIKETFIEKLVEAYKELYPETDSETNAFFGKMVSQQAATRMEKLMTQGQIRFGGKVDVENRKVNFTILDDVNMDAELMNEEIFGPLLPIVTFDNLDQTIKDVNLKERPLAAYYFGSSRTAAVFAENILAGGVGINDTIMQIANPKLPFGGVGTSGMGAYHGKHSFDCFSHTKAVVQTPTWIDLPFKYPPFKYMGVIKKLLG
jgi:aldehyde dehydrogenase (NAD+)